MESAEEVRNKNTCSFCNRPYTEVRRVFAGSGVYICDGCVESEFDIVTEKIRETITLRNPVTGSTVTCGPYEIKRLEQLVAALSDPVVRSRVASLGKGAEDALTFRQNEVVEALRRERDLRDQCVGQYISAGYEIAPS